MSNIFLLPKSLSLKDDENVVYVCGWDPNDANNQCLNKRYGSGRWNICSKKELTKGKRAVF